MESARITLEDGLSFVRDTFFVFEGGEWKHRFGEEVYGSSMPGVPFEEFVEAQLQHRPHAGSSSGHSGGREVAA